MKPKTNSSLLGTLLACSLLASLAWAQAPPVAGWQYWDPEASGVRGVSTAKAYQYLEGRQARQVVVALIGPGVDIGHEDLEDHIWVNEDEIPGNGVDDDRNGFTDDLHGWNFLGNAQGKNLCFETLELTRLYRAYAQRFVGVQDIDITEAERPDYAFYQQIKTEYETELQRAREELSQLENIYKNYQSALLILRQHTGKSTLSPEMVEKIKTKEEAVEMARNYYLELYERGYMGQSFEALMNAASQKLEYHLNPRFDPRPEIIGDNPGIWDDGPYGNPDVSDDQTEKGTPAAGIIAAMKGNDPGTSPVRLMVLRAVPDGDERDKDVAHAILYAISNGADIIVIGFGKGHSPQKQWVDSAIRLAEERGLLVVQAAGDDGQNLDETNRYPSPYLNGFSTPVNNWLTVAASSWGKNFDLVPAFSNYGARRVDLFAPGEDIYAPLPGNRYGYEGGTGIACAMVAGTAALVWAYFPELSAAELRDVLMASVISSRRWKVQVPAKTGERKRRKTRFWKLSASGGILNAYEAVRLAEERIAQK